MSARPLTTRSGPMLAAAGFAVVFTATCGTPESPPASEPSPDTTEAADETSPGEAGTAEPDDEDREDGAPSEPEVVADGVDVPWGLALLEGGSALVTLRDEAEILRVAPGEEAETLGRVPNVATQEESGLLGVAVSPDDDSQVFIYFTTEEDNRVVRGELEGGEFHATDVILSGIPRSPLHNGGRIEFGPDGYLYVATGDAQQGESSQDPDSLAGKILRIDTDGEPAPENPTDGSPVWSMGHRNVQGMGWDSQGRMFASEFGQDTWDELNLIEPGNNYGWPAVEGIAETSEFTDPLHQWRPAESSPSGLAVTDSAIYMAALRGESLWRIPLTDVAASPGGSDDEDEETLIGEPQRLLEGEYGRLRTVVAEEENRLWIVTNNTFRGAPRQSDDQIIILDPQR